MRSRDFSDWMWGEALALVDRAERLQRRFFHVAEAWEPPVDVVETADALRVQVALPGVAPEEIGLRLEPDAITISALRAFPASERGARIHRFEIPYGRFERRLALPLHALELPRRSHVNGVLTLEFARKERA